MLIKSFAQRIMQIGRCHRSTSYRYLLGAGIVVVASAATAASVAFAAQPAASSAHRMKIPPQKQAILNQEKARQSAARSQHARKPSQAPTGGAAESIPPRVSELIKGIRQGPFSPEKFQSNSLWQGAVRGLWLQAYAGADVTGVARIGELKLYSMPINPNKGPNVFNYLGAYAPPTSETGLSILKIAGHDLYLTGKSGRTYSFNLRTRRYASP